MGYRIDVITDSVSEAVRHAGGLMFDRSRAGWDVVVLTDDPDNSRALAILGARTHCAGQLDDRYRERQREIRTVVTAADGTSAGGRLELESGAQLLLWGHRAEDESARVLQPVRHRLGAAALSFKTQALHAIGVATTIGDYEHFWAHPTLGAEPAVEWAGSRSPTSMGG